MELQKKEESKNSKSVRTWFNAISSTTGHEVCRHNFVLWPVRERDSIIIYLLAYRTAYFSNLNFLSYLTLFLLYFTLLSSSLLLG